MKLEFRNAAFALEFAVDTPPVNFSVFSVSWTSEALRELKAIRDEATRLAKEKDDEAWINLPYASLRAQLFLEIPDWAAIDDDVALRSPYVPAAGAGDPGPWGYLVSDNAAGDLQRVKDAFARWAESTLAGFCESRGAHSAGVANLRRLSTSDRILRVTESEVQVFPWSSAPVSRGLPTHFDVTAGLLAARVAGHELFPDLGPVVRVMGGPNHNSAEVMTRPHRAETGGRFSLVCEFTVESLPGQTKPLIFCRFKRRRWANNAKSGFVASNSIGGFVFPHTHRPKHAYRFSVQKGRDGWKTDLGYGQYEHAFELAAGHASESVFDYPSDSASASVVVMLKAEVTELEDSQLLAGVPLVDQADAFERIAEVLHSLGLRPFTDFQRVKFPTLSPPRLSMLKADATLARLLVREEVDADQSVEAALQSATDAPADRFFKKGVPTPDPKHDQIVAAIRMLTQDTAFANDASRQQIYLVTQSPDDMAWVKATISAMLGDSVRVISAALPPNTHGPRDSFAAGTNRQRFDARAREWIKFAQSAKLPPRAMVLIQAPLYYTTASGKKARDDSVNKLAARKALGRMGCTVQYLLPSDEGRVEKFLPRAQAAVLDLVFGHAGSVWGLRQACGACFADDANVPKWVAAVSSIVTKGAWTGERQQSVFVATKLEVATGQAWVRFAHQLAEPVVTSWMRFDEGAKYLASSRMEMPGKRPDRMTLASRFFEAVFDDLCATDPNAIVFIDSTRHASHAPWLSDRGVQGKGLEVSPGVFAGTRWPTIRLLRIREQTPSLGLQRTFDGTRPDGKPVSTWTTAPRLFQVGGVTAPTFWSLSKPPAHQKRGVSCYRETFLPSSKRADEIPSEFSAVPAQPDEQHMNARAVEIVVLQKQPRDDDVQLASFAQHLRTGLLTARLDRWVSSPTPLRIVEKLSEYMRG